jgi:hypothetical protein
MYTHGACRWTVQFHEWCYSDKFINVDKRSVFHSLSKSVAVYSVQFKSLDGTSARFMLAAQQCIIV